MRNEALAVRFGRFFGSPLAEWLAKLPFKINPNIITLSSLIPGFLAGFCFLSNQLLLGVLFFILSFILDCTDGEFARITNQVTDFGKKLDFRVDVIRIGFMYFGLWYSQYYLHGIWFIGGSILFLHYCVMVFGYMFIEYELLFSSSFTSHDEGLITFMFLPLFCIFYDGAFQVGLPILILLQFFSYLSLFIRQKNKPNMLLNVKKSLKLVKDE